MKIEKTSRWRGTDVELFLLTADDVSDAYIDWLNDPAINRFLESRFSRHDRASTVHFVENLLGSPRDLFLGIRDVSLGRHVGNIKLGPIDLNHGLGEIGIMIGDRAAWGRGVATAAIARLAEIARDELGLRKLTAGCYASNLGSQKAFERAGFVVEGVRPRQFVLDDACEDAILLGRILRTA